MGWWSYMDCLVFVFVFFFKQKTAYEMRISDWSSDVCSSDLLKYRGKFDGTPDVTKFAETLERVCVETVEKGHMTKDLAILIGPDQPWMTTEQFFEAIRSNLESAMSTQGLG